MISYRFDTDKAIQALLYISNRILKNGFADKYATLKILYFAEKNHLSTYGRLITDDRFAALKYGPVPSNSLDILDNSSVYSKFFNVINNKSFAPRVTEDQDLLSESDIECLNIAINENKHLDFEGLKNKSHDEAYHEAFDNDIHYMNIESIAKQEGADTFMIGFIKEHYDVLSLVKWLPA